MRVVVFGAFGNQETADFAPVIEELAKAYGDKIQIRFKHKVLPLPHPDAVQASEASLAANAQGKFWPYHDKLFGAQGVRTAYTADSLKKYAVDLGLNASAFNTCLDTGETQFKVRNDSEEGANRG